MLLGSGPQGGHVAVEARTQGQRGWRQGDAQVAASIRGSGRGWGTPRRGTRALGQPVAFHSLLTPGHGPGRGAWHMAGGVGPL